MQKITIPLILFFFLASPAFANWAGDFLNNFEDKGIEIAVPKALEDGITPSDIVAEGLKQTSLNPQTLLKALYCSGAAGDDIKAAADGNGISEIIVVAAYKKSIAECGDAVADSQAYTPAGPRFAGPPAAGGGGNSFASPSTF